MDKNQTNAQAVETTKQVDKQAQTAMSDEMKEYISKMIKSETDKVRTEYSKKLKAKEKEIEALQEKNVATMSEAEKLSYEKEQFEAKMNEQLKAFNDQKAKFMGTQMLHKYGLADDELSFLPFVMDADEEIVSQKCESLKAYLDANVKKQVESRFKQSGRNPNGSETSTKTEADKQVEYGKMLAHRKADQQKRVEQGENFYFKH